MRFIQLYLVGREKKKLRLICYNRMIKDFLANSFGPNIVMDDYKIYSVLGTKVDRGQCWIILDKDCNLLPIYADVPDKFMLMLIDVSVLALSVIGFEELEEVQVLNKFFKEYYGIVLGVNIKEPFYERPIKPSPFLKEVIKVSAVSHKSDKKELPRGSNRISQLNEQKTVKPVVTEIKPKITELFNKSLKVEKKVIKEPVVKVFNIPKKPVVFVKPKKQPKLAKPIVLSKPKKIIRVNRKPVTTFKEIKQKVSKPKLTKEKPLPLFKPKRPKIEAPVAKKVVQERVNKKPKILKPLVPVATASLDIKPKKVNMVVKINNDGSAKVLTAFEKPKVESKRVSVNPFKPKVTEPVRNRVVEKVVRKPVTEKVVKKEEHFVKNTEKKVSVHTESVEVKVEKVKEEKQTLLGNDNSTDDKVSRKQEVKTEVKARDKRTSEVKEKPQEPRKQEIKKETKQEIKKEIKQEESKKEQKEEPKIQEMVYQVVSPEGEVLYTKSLENQQPMTVEQILMQSGLNINNSKGFIEGINGINNEGMSGWVFEVNNAPVMVSAAEYVVNPTDQITWKYVDFSKFMSEEPVVESSIQQESPSKTLVREKVVA